MGYTFLLQDPKQSAIKANCEGRVIEMGICGKCIHKDKVGTEYPCGVCDNVTHYEEARPQTNADRIREMSDEELEDFLNNVDGQYYSKSMVPSWKDWLKQEVAE